MALGGAPHLALAQWRERREKTGPISAGRVPGSSPLTRLLLRLLYDFTAVRAKEQKLAGGQGRESGRAGERALALAHTHTGQGILALTHELDQAAERGQERASLKPWEAGERRRRLVADG